VQHRYRVHIFEVGVGLARAAESCLAHENRNSPSIRITSLISQPLIAETAFDDRQAM
jgi:hypothetical protein